MISCTPGSGCLRSAGESGGPNSYGLESSGPRPAGDGYSGQRQFLGNNHDQFPAVRLDGFDGTVERMLRPLLAVISNDDGLAHPQIMAAAARDANRGAASCGESLAYHCVQLSRLSIRWASMSRVAMLPLVSKSVVESVAIPRPSTNSMFVT